MNKPTSSKPFTEVNDSLTESTPTFQDGLVSIEELSKLTEQPPKEEEVLTSEDIESSLKQKEESEGTVNEVTDITTKDVDVPIVEKDGVDTVVPTPSSEEDKISLDMNSGYKEVVKKLFGDYTFMKEDEEGNEVEVDLEKEDVDQEFLINAIESKLKEQEDALTKDRVSTDHLTDFTKKLIEIEKDGGNITEALTLYQQLQEPIKDIDLTTEEGQIKTLETRLRADNRDDEEISDLIDAYKLKGVLEDKAYKAKEQLDSYFAEETDRQAAKAQEDKVNREEALKKYKKEIKGTFKKTFQLKDSVVDKLVEYSTKQDEEGKYPINVRYNEMRQDPELASELALFLFDKEEYKKQITKDSLNKEKVTTLKKMNLIKRDSPSVVTSKKDKDSNGRYVSLEDFK